MVGSCNSLLSHTWASVVCLVASDALLLLCRIDGGILLYMGRKRGIYGYIHDSGGDDDSGGLQDDVLGLRI